MADVDELGYSGLQLKDNAVLLQEIQTDWQNTYSKTGEQINFTSSSPDGQITNILAQIGTTIREIITEIYNCQDPSKCIGDTQDKMYQINYLSRKAGTFTRQNINITVDRTVTLQGLDGSYNDTNASAYTVSDDSGNVWYLIDTTTLYAGTTSCPFRAKEIGEVIPVIGTITNPVTIVNGVTSVINSIGYTILGEQEESDADFRIRREYSVATKSKNNIDTMQSQILALDGVTNCTIWANNTNSTDSTSTPAHTIWCIVGGGANTEIAQAIYANLAGSATRGSVTNSILTNSGQTFTINFDRPTLVPLYIQFDLKLAGTDPAQINETAIKEYIVNNLSYVIGEDAETSKVTEVCALALSSNGGGYAVNVEISTDGETWVDYVASATKASQFVIDTTRITINIVS